MTKLHGKQQRYDKTIYTYFNLTLYGKYSMSFFLPSTFFLNGRVCYTEKKRALFDLQISAPINFFPLIFSRVPWNLNDLSTSSWNTLLVIICTLKNRQQDLYSPCLRTIVIKREENIRKQWLDFITKGSFVFTMSYFLSIHLFK